MIAADRPRPKSRPARRYDTVGLGRRVMNVAVLGILKPRIIRYISSRSVDGLEKTGRRVELAYFPRSYVKTKPFTACMPHILSVPHPYIVPCFPLNMTKRIAEF